MSSTYHVKVINSENDVSWLGPFTDVIEARAARYEQNERGLYAIVLHSTFEVRTQARVWREGR